MKTLWQVFYDSPDEIVYGRVWKIYNTKDHNRLIINNYGKLLGVNNIDDAEFVKMDTSKLESHNIVKVYVRFDPEFVYRVGVENRDEHLDVWEYRKDEVELAMARYDSIDFHIGEYKYLKNMVTDEILLEDFK